MALHVVFQGWQVSVRTGHSASMDPAEVYLRMLRSRKLRPKMLVCPLQLPSQLGQAVLLPHRHGWNADLKFARRCTNMDHYAHQRH